jgi:hypothetical protein
MLRIIIRSLLFMRVAVIVIGLPLSSSALTRWSTVHYIPDADFIEGWKYTGEYAGYFSRNEQAGGTFKHSGFARIGLSEWANVEGGYAGGLTLGMKIKVLSEGDGYHPSVAVGATNILRNKEAYFYDTAQNLWKNEYYLSFGKSINPIRLRFHFGMSTMPEVDREKLDLFFALEKYLGGNAYLTIETFYRDKKLRPSLFGTLRLFDQRVELSAGAVDLVSMFMDENNKFAASFSSPRVPGLVVPGIWLGLRYVGRFQLPGGSFGGFGSLEEQQKYQNGVIKILRHDVDSLEHAIVHYDERITEFNTSFNRIADSAFENSNNIKYRNLAIEQLTIINTLYGQEDFDPEKVAQAKKTVLDYGNVMVPILQEIVLDNKVERKIHARAMAMISEIATQKSADAILDIMGQTLDSDVKIEGIVAIEKAKDRRAVYLLDQLANDANPTIAFAATEVIQKLEKRAPLKKDSLGTNGAPKVPKTIPDKKIEEEDWDKFMTTDTTSAPESTSRSPAHPAGGSLKKTPDTTVAKQASETSGINAEESAMTDDEKINVEKKAEKLANEPPAPAVQSEKKSPVPLNQGAAAKGKTVKKEKKKAKNNPKTDEDKKVW